NVAPRQSLHENQIRHARAHPHPRDTPPETLQEGHAPRHHQPVVAQEAYIELVLSPSAVNKRRTALQHLFTVLDGKSAPNPVKNVPKFREPDPRTRPSLRRRFAACSG